MREKLNNRYFEIKNDKEIEEIISIGERFGLIKRNPTAIAIHKGVNYVEFYDGMIYQFNNEFAIKKTSTLTTIEELREITNPYTLEQLSDMKFWETRQLECMIDEPMSFIGETTNRYAFILNTNYVVCGVEGDKLWVIDEEKDKHYLLLKNLFKRFKIIPREPATIAQTCDTKKELENEIKNNFGKVWSTVILKHGATLYEGKRTQLTAKQQQEREVAMTKACRGRYEYLKLNTSDGFVLIPGSILKQCTYRFVVEM